MEWALLLILIYISNLMDFYSIFFFFYYTHRARWGSNKDESVSLSYLNSIADLMFIFPDSSVLIWSFVNGKLN